MLTPSQLCTNVNARFIHFLSPLINTFLYAILSVEKGKKSMHFKVAYFPFGNN